MNQATPYLDTTDNSLIYALPVDGKVGKVAVRINFGEKVRLDGVRDRVVSNFVRSGGLIDASNLDKESRYLSLKE